VQNDLSRICKNLNYQFDDIKLLKLALTHCSASSDNNERFEFLGDSILSFIIASLLFKQFPQASEGELSRLRAYLVKGDTLAEIAKEINLGEHLILGQGEMKSGGFRRASILADTLEAVIAAIYLDNGVKASREVITHLFKKRLSSDSLSENLKDSKTQLQEYLQARKISLPQYELLDVEGEHHKQTFSVRCSVEKLCLEAVGKGTSRRKAEQGAAKKYLKSLKATKIV
jgi:ribonuclease III